MLAAARWHPTIGDPTPMGWLTVAAYVGAAALCLATAARAGKSNVGPAWLWWTATTAMTALAINKQLDLQSWLTEVAKDAALQQGWYEDRRRIQYAFVIAVAAVSVSGAAVAAWMLRRSVRQTWLVLLGLTAVVGYVVMRAASFHHFDELIAASPGGVRMNWVFELAAISLVAAGAWKAQRQSAGA